MYLNKPSDKYDVHYHAEIYALIYMKAVFEIMLQKNSSDIFKE